VKQAATNSLARSTKPAGAALWTKQDFEESLGKSETIGLKVVIGEKPPKPPGYGSDRAFLFVGASDAATGLRRAGYPVAVLKLPPAARSPATCSSSTTRCLASGICAA
jgi:hypothetical protein